MTRRDYIYLCLFFFIPFVIGKTSQQESLLNSNTNNIFYAKLDAWITLPIGQQIDSLKSFIKRYPGYHRAYLKLEDRLIKADRINEIRKFFQSFNEQSDNFSNAQWMLARYFNFKEEHKVAAAHFEKAISYDKDSITILFNYLSFKSKMLRKNNRKFNPEAFNLSHYDSNIVEAYACFLSCEYSDALALLEKCRPFENLELYFQYLLAIYRLGNIQRAIGIAESGMLTAQKAEDRYFYNQFYLILLKSRFWLYGHDSITSDLRCLKKSLKQSDDTLLIINCSKFEAQIHKAKLEYEKAIKKLENAAEGFAKFYDWDRAANCYYNIAELHYLMTDNTLALQSIEKCVELNEKNPNFETLTRAFQLYGKIYRDLCLYELSEKYLHRASQAASKSDNPYIFIGVDDIFREQRAVNSPSQEAVTLYKDWIQKRKSENYINSVFFPTYSLAMEFEKLGQYDSSFFYYERALQLANQNKNKMQVAWAQIGLAGIHFARDNTVTAFALVDSTLTTAHEQNHHRLLAHTHLVLGKYHERKDSLNAAIQFYQQAIEQYEIIRRELKASELAMGFLSDRQEVYQRLSECYYKKYIAEKKTTYLEHIFNNEELMHARALKDEIRSSNGQSRDEQDLKDYYRLCQGYQNVQLAMRRQRQKISKQTLDSLLAELQIYKYDIVSEKIRLGHTLPKEMLELHLPPLTRVQKKLANQTAILYHVSERLAFALVIQEDSCTTVPLDLTQTQMDTFIQTLMQPFHHVDNETILDTPFHASIAHLLYQKLFQPIENRCRLTSQILIIPTLSLAHLPFDLLLMHPPEQSIYTPREKPDYIRSFLCQKHAFYYSPSVHMLFRQPPECAPKMLIVANPFVEDDQPREKEFTLRLRTGWRFDPLIFAEREATLIKHYCKNAKILSRHNATENKIKSLASNYSIVHIASHAFVDTTFDIFSGLALANDKSSDGLLMGFEIANADFSCDLVTLSACETGRGKLIHGEGVLGLPRQFISSGTHSVIMSKWKVDDEFTADFMPAFYKNYIKEGMSKVASLSMAKRDVLNNPKNQKDYYHKHPFFWAAFNLYGEAGSSHDPQMLHQSPPNVRTWLTIGLAIAGFAGLLLLVYLRLIRKSHA